MADGTLILNEIRTAIRRFANADVVDMDAQFNHKFGLEAFRLEDVLTPTQRFIPPNKWSYYRIGFIKQGSGEFTTGIYNYTARKNTLVVIPSRVITSSKNWSMDLKGVVLLFNLDFFVQNNFPYQYIESKKILNSSIQPYIQLNDNQATVVEELIETIMTEKQSDHTHKEELIALKLIELLIYCERLFEEALELKLTIPPVDIIKRFTDLLENNFTKERSVSYYASELNVHPNHLNLMIKKHTGLTAKESITNRLLLETKYLLHSTTLSIKEISNQVGFNDPNYFTVFFKRFEKMSPATYRSSVM